VRPFSIGAGGPRSATSADNALQIYLPIADLPVNVFFIFMVGIVVGFLSGMFGIGGGFLLTPLLILIGISPAVAVATVSSHITASSLSGVMAYWRRKTLDLALAAMLLAGALVGTAGGVWLIALLRAAGQLDCGIDGICLLHQPPGHHVHRHTDVGSIRLVVEDVQMQSDDTAPMSPDAYLPGHSCFGDVFESVTARQ